LFCGKQVKYVVLSTIIHTARIPYVISMQKVYRNGYVGGAAIAALIGGTTKQEDSQDRKEGKGHNTT